MSEKKRARPKIAGKDTDNEANLLNNRAAQLETIVDNIPEAVIVMDPQGRLLLMNRAAESLLGKPHSDSEPENWPETYGLYLDDGSTYYPGDKLPMVRALRGETVEGEEMILRQTEGSSRWISMSAKPLTNDDEQPRGAITIFRDITYRKQIELSREKHIQRTETLYRFSRALAEAANDLNQITQTIANYAAETIGDTSIVSLLDSGGEKLRIAAFHHPLASARAALRKLLISIGFESPPSAGIAGGAIKSGEPVLIPFITTEQLEAITVPEFVQYIREVGVESILIVPVNSKSGVLGVISLSRDRGGNPYTVEDQGFLKDLASRAALAIENCRLFDSLKEEITERLSVVQALHESEERFRSIFDSTTLGIKVLDLDGVILQTNPAFQLMMGYSESELVGRYFYSFLYPGDDARALRLFHDLKVSNSPDFRFEHRALNKDGELLWLKTTFTGVTKGGGDDSLAFVFGIVENVTKQKQVDLDLQELKNRLQGSVELERLRLAQELHDGPMQDLYSAIYQIEGLRMQAEPQMEELLEAVKLDIQRVLQGLRATAKELRPPTISTFGLEKAIRSHVEDFQIKHPNLNIQLSLAEDKQLLPENVRIALFRVYQNSLTNVVRHAEATQVQVHFMFDAEEVRLEIIDNGKGFKVPKNWVELVRHGHFGLASSAERVSALGGIFTVESQPQVMTQVRVVIPRQDLPDQPDNNH